MALIEYATAGGVVIHEGRMLLLDRPRRGEVRLPKGHIEPGESPEAAAIRETIEESGVADIEIVADLGEQIVEFDYQTDHYRRQERYYLMRKTGDSYAARPAHDEDDFRPMWLPMAQAASMLTFPSEQAVATKAVAAYERLSEVGN